MIGDSIQNLLQKTSTEIPVSNPGKSRGLELKQGRPKIFIMERFAHNRNQTDLNFLEYSFDEL